MDMKCPICGNAMEKRYGFSGDLYQREECRYVCKQCGRSGPSEDDILEETVRRLQKEMAEGAE